MKIIHKYQTFFHYKQWLNSLLWLVFLITLSFWTAHASENGALTGYVVDVAQAPVQGAEIFIYTSGNTRKPADYISPPSDNSGQFKVVLPPGNYWAVARVRLGKERFGPLRPGDKHSGAPIEISIDPGDSIEEEFIVADLEETSKLTVKSNESFVKIQGYILTEQGEPVEKGYVYVNLSPARKKIPDYVSAWTDETGRYILYLPDGIYYFASAMNFPPEQGSVDFQQVKVDSSTKNINIITSK